MHEDYESESRKVIYMEHMWNFIDLGWTYICQDCLDRHSCAHYSDNFGCDSWKPAFSYGNGSVEEVL